MCSSGQPRSPFPGNKTVGAANQGRRQATQSLPCVDCGLGTVGALCAQRLPSLDDTGSIAWWWFDALYANGRSATRMAHCMEGITLVPDEPEGCFSHELIARIITRESDPLARTGRVSPLDVAYITLKAMRASANGQAATICSANGSPE